MRGGKLQGREYRYQILDGLDLSELDELPMSDAEALEAEMQAIARRTMRWALGAIALGIVLAVALIAHACIPTLIAPYAATPACGVL